MTRFFASIYQTSSHPSLYQGEGVRNSNTQLQLDAAFTSFSSQATDVSSIATFTLAGLVGKIARLGALSSLSSLGLQRFAGASNFTSHLIGIGTEAAAFEGISRIHNPTSQSFSHNWLNHFINFSAFRIMGVVAPGESAAFQHLSQSSAMLLGHQGAAALGLEERKQESLWNQFFHASLSTFEIQTASSLGARLTGHHIAALERNLESEAHRLSRKNHQNQHFIVPDENLFSMRSNDEIVAPAPHPVLEDLEGRPRDPVRQLTEIKEALHRATENFRTAHDTIEDPNVREEYTREFLRLGENVQFWERQQKAARRSRGAPLQRFTEDILIGQRILLDHVLRLSAAMISEPIVENDLSQWGLRTQLNIFPPKERIARLKGTGAEQPAPTTPEGVTILPAAITREVGFGKALRLWSHQAEALQTIRAALRLIQDRFARGEIPSIDYLQGNIGIPVGGGKTRLMSAAFAAAIEAGMFRPGIDKFLIFNHTDQIHKQNIDEINRLNEYFREQFGRDLVVTQYKADEKNLSGDVCVISIPTAGTEIGREAFKADLLRELGRNISGNAPEARGEVIMGAVDEVHHLGFSGKTQAKMWKSLMDTVREVSPLFFRLGFSGSLSGDEGRILYRLRERALLLSGITPRRYLVPVEGIDLSNIRVSSAGEFNQTQMKSTLLGHPERNHRLFEAYEKWGLRSETPSPSGRERFKATIGYCDTLEHGQMIVNDFQNFFGGSGEGVRGRKIRTLGTDKGNISQKEIERALKDYREGRIDSIACLISGKTRKIHMTLNDGSVGDMTDFILERSTAGEIEVVCNDSALREGANLNMFFNQWGARSTFSPFSERQEAGRTNRRSTGELGPNGELFRDPPRILFNVIDRYYNPENPRTLIRYADVIGCVDPRQAKYGDLFDVLGDKVVDQVDLEGRITRPSLIDLFEQSITPPPVPPITPEAPIDVSVGTSPDVSGTKPISPSNPPPPPRPREWHALTSLLRNILEKQYNNDLRLLARNLGESPEYVEGLLRGEGWSSDPWRLRRFSTLLYQDDREAFYAVFNGGRKGKHEPARVSFSLRESLDHTALNDFKTQFPRWARKKGPLTAETLRDAIREFAAARPAHPQFYELLLALYENANLKSSTERERAEHFLTGRSEVRIEEIRSLQTELAQIVRGLLRN